MGLTLNQLDQAAGGIAKGYEAGSNVQINRQDAKNRQGEENRKTRDDANEQIFRGLFEGRDAALSPAPPQQPAGGALPGSAPTSGAVPTGQAPAPAPTSRRDRYNSWRPQAEAAAMRAGGLNGLEAFNKMEDAYSRKELLGYGMAGVQAMADGSAGEAVKQFNTMLEASPQDTGMKFEAFDGKVYMVGSDGKRGEPYTQESAMALIESKLKTPENYLQFQEELRLQGTADEAVRSHKAGEKTDARNAATNEGILKVNEDKQALDEKLAPRETSAREAQALAALINAKSAGERAAAALAAKNSWTPSQQLQIYKDADNWSLTDQMIPKNVQAAYNDDEMLWGQHKSDVMNQMTNNPFDKGPTREEASAVSIYLRQPGGETLNGKAKLKAAQDKETGEVFVNYGGKMWKLPYDLGSAALKMGVIQDPIEPPADETAEGGGNKEGNAEQPPSEVLPTAQQNSSWTNSEGRVEVPALRAVQDELSKIPVRGGQKYYGSNQ